MSSFFSPSPYGYAASPKVRKTAASLNTNKILPIKLLPNIYYSKKKSIQKKPLDEVYL